MPGALLVAVWAALCPGDFTWINPPRMHNPTPTSVTIAAVPDMACEIEVVGDELESTGPQIARGKQLFEFTIEGLTPGSILAATLRSRPLGAVDWSDETPLTLRTLPPRHEPTRFAIAADPHTWALYSRWLVGPSLTNSFEKMQAVIDNVAADSQLDFAIALTDTAMTNCGGCAAAFSPFGTATEGDVDDASDAVTRYRATWSDEMLGRIAMHVPTFVVNGDHEGEAAYMDAAMVQASTAGRAATLPRLRPAMIRGPVGTHAFAVESGPVLLAFLDVHSMTSETPTSPDHWTLGAAQLDWLADVLGASARPWKLVFAEHLVGGLTDPTSAFWKGRGGITATHDGTPAGIFLGEQALIHNLMQATSADMFISAQDHVAAWGEKDGIAYLIAGRASGVSHPWTDDDWYAEVMDYDGDGIPEYETDVTGSKKPGHVVIDAHHDTLTVQYIRGSPSPLVNAQVVLEYVLEND